MNRTPTLAPSCEHCGTSLEVPHRPINHFVPCPRCAWAYEVRRAGRWLVIHTAHEPASSADADAC